MTADEEELSIIAYFDGISLISCLNQGFRAAYNLIYGEGLFCN
jgi:hypothetical protein